MQKKCELLATVDSSEPEYHYVAEGFLGAFEHLGMPYEELDLAKERMSARDLTETAALIIAQEGMGGKFSTGDATQISQAVEQAGVGLVNFDHRLSAYPPPLRRLLSGGDGDISYGRARGLRVSDDSHFATCTYKVNEKTEFLQDVEQAALPSAEPSETGLVNTLEGHPVLRAAHCGEGRLVQFLVSPRMWHSDYLGHLRGADGLFWRGIVWAARKPFLMMMFPPFVACRIDDANGSANIFGTRAESANKRFAYLQALNEHGYVPSVGLFIDDITDADSKIIKEAHDTGRAQFSPHAFSDPENTNAHPIYMRHNGEEFSPDELRGIFERVDRRFQQWGIPLARTVNAHFGQVGVHSLPFLKERGVTSTMSPGVAFGCTWTAAAEGATSQWHPKPYGDHGFNYDRVPEHPEFFNVVAHPLGTHKLEEVGMGTSDFLWWKTRFWEESPFNDLAGAAQKAASIIKLGLDGRFFGCLMTHEQRIATLSEAEWEEVLTRIDELTAGYEQDFQSYDHIAEYAKSKFDTRILEATHDPISKQARLSVAGESSLPLKVYVFGDETPHYDVAEIPAFVGEKEIAL